MNKSVQFKSVDVISIKFGSMKLCFEQKSIFKKKPLNNIESSLFSMFLNRIVYSFKSNYHFGTLFVRNQLRPRRQLGGALLYAPCLSISRHSSNFNSTTSIISSSTPPPLVSLSESVTSQ